MQYTNNNSITPPLSTDIKVWLEDMRYSPELDTQTIVEDKHNYYLEDQYRHQHYEQQSSPVCLRKTERCYRTTERKCLYLQNPHLPYLKLASSSSNSLESIQFESIENVNQNRQTYPSVSKTTNLNSFQSLENLNQNVEMVNDAVKKSDINQIFDTGENVIPPIPPTRKKRREVIYENIWDFRVAANETSVQYEKFENDSELSSSNHELTDDHEFDFCTSVSSIEENIYENIPPIHQKFMVYTPPIVNNECRLWQSTPNLYLCSAEEVNFASEVVTSIHDSTLLTGSKLDLLCERVTVRKNSVTSDIAQWSKKLLHACESENFIAMEDKSLLTPNDYCSRGSSPVLLRKQDSLSPTPTAGLRNHFLFGPKSKSFVRFDSRRYKAVDENALTIVKEGKIDRSKIVDCNKKQKKWIQNSYGCLTKKSFYLFESKKIFDVMKTGVKDKRNYDMKIDINFCEIRMKSEYTSRKNVLALIDSSNGSQILLQFDNKLEKDEWFNCISNSLEVLRPSAPSRPQTFMEGLPLPDIQAKEQKRIKSKLKIFFGGRRPSVDDLIKNGIYKDESVFGSELEILCKNMERPKIPDIVKICIKAIEPYLETEGIYRASGNLSQIQKIRFEVDQHNYENITVDRNDIHVLTGALKLFFRELKTSLIPANEYDSCMEASDCPDPTKTINHLKKILKRFPDSHRDTLQYLMKHLLDVSKFESKNRMDLLNLATVWAPNLLEKRATTPSTKDFSMFVDCTLQMKLIKTFLQNYNDIFN